MTLSEEKSKIELFKDLDLDWLNLRVDPDDGKHQDRWKAWPCVSNICIENKKIWCWYIFDIFSKKIVLFHV